MVVVNDLNGGLVGEAEWSVWWWQGAGRWCWKRRIENALYSQVHEQVTKAKATMRTLAEEFTQPDPSAAETPERPR
jgi:hypothetical protein